VRSMSGPAGNLAHAVADAIAGEDPTAVVSFRTLHAQVNAALVQERLMATLAGFFGVLGLLLAAVGLYGVTAQGVAARRGEIAIRMALGATADGVVRFVLTRTAWLVAIGTAAGVGLSLWAGKFVTALLYGLKPSDPLSMIAAAATLAAVAAVAGWLPARRAARIDPMDALRN